MEPILFILMSEPLCQRHIWGKTHFIFCYKDLGKLHIGENVKEMLECDLKIEHDGRNDYIEAITYCESVKDYVTRDLLRDLLADEEGHIDHIETQLKLIEQVGIQNYLQKHMALATDEE